MGHELSAQQVREFLATVGGRARTSATLLLLGGSGLRLLGNTRPTLDIDYDGEEGSLDEFHVLMEAVAADMRIELEAVPLHRFIPLPAGSRQRHVPIGTFGRLKVMVFDPYSIALSKLDRGFDTDIEDVAFLLRERFVELELLSTMINDAAKFATAYDLNPSQMHLHLILAQKALSDH